VTEPEHVTRKPVARSRPGQGSAFSSELLKLVSLPAERVLLAAAVGSAGLIAALIYISVPVTKGRALSELAPSEILGAGMLGVDAAAFVAIIVAAIHIGSEYSSGMIESTLTITPARRYVLVGKFATVAVVAVAVGVAAAALCALAAVIVAGGLGIGASAVFAGGGIQFTLGSVATPVFYALVGAAAAFIFRSTALGIAVPLALRALTGIAGWFGEPISAVLVPIMPGAALHSLSGAATDHESIGVIGALASLVVWLGVGIGAAAWRFLRGDAQ
jgi:ABC-2 type transport system permease protein